MESNEEKPLISDHYISEYKQEELIIKDENKAPPNNYSNLEIKKEINERIVSKIKELESNEEKSLIGDNYVTGIKQEELIIKDENEDEDDMVWSNNEIKHEVNEKIVFKLYNHTNDFKKEISVVSDHINEGFHPTNKKICECTLKRHHEKKYKCSMCEKSFFSEPHLKQHFVVHTREKKPQEKCKCPTCQKLFFKDYLTKHLATHTGKKSYMCSICEKTFSQISNLNTHSVIHTGEKKYKCSICEKTFNQKSNLNTHLRIHTGEKKYKCPICEKTFSLKGNLNTHLVVHTGEEKYKCSICGKTFPFKSSLAQHLRIHSGEKKYKRSFSEKKNSFSSYC